MFGVKVRQETDDMDTVSTQESFLATNYFYRSVNKIWLVLRVSKAVLQHIWNQNLIEKPDNSDYSKKDSSTI